MLPLQLALRAPLDPILGAFEEERVRRKFLALLAGRPQRGVTLETAS